MSHQCEIAITISDIIQLNPFLMNVVLLAPRFPCLCDRENIGSKATYHQIQVHTIRYCDCC